MALRQAVRTIDRIPVSMERVTPEWGNKVEVDSPQGWLIITPTRRLFVHTKETEALMLALKVDENHPDVDTDSGNTLTKYRPRDGVTRYGPSKLNKTAMDAITAAAAAGDINLVEA